MNQERIELKIRKITYRLVLNVRHWSGSGSYADSVAIESDTPFATIHNGKRIRIAGVEGFPESRLTTGVVVCVSHHLRRHSRLYARGDGVRGSRS